MAQSNEIVSDAVETSQASDALSGLVGLLIELQIVDPPTETATAKLNAGSNTNASVLLPAALQTGLTKSDCPEETSQQIFENRFDGLAEQAMSCSPQLDALTQPAVWMRNALIESAIACSPQLDALTQPALSQRSQPTTFDDEFAALERLQTLLVAPDLLEFRSLVEVLTQKLTALEHQIYEPTALIKLLLPWVAELLSQKIAESKEEVVRAIAPIIDQIIQNRGEQDKVAMSAALSPLIAAAIAQQTNHSPEAMAMAIAPTIGRAVKEQILLEQDVMVDALYPIIGSTIAKYMAEAIQSINQQIENTLSPEGIRRKIRAKIQGVSEAELIFKQAIPFTVQAIFLIHKASGLLIADIQPASDHSLESEMVAGMLTAIRSFANECMAQAGGASELDQIDYGGAKIILEAAGYCYLAVVVQGDPPRSFILKLRQTLRTLVKHYGKQLEAFDGDPATVPAAVEINLEALRDQFADDRPAASAKPPVLLIGILGLLSLVGIPLGLDQYHQGVARQAESKTALALAAMPALSVYRLDVQASHGTLTLTGRVPNALLRWQAEQTARRVAPTWTVANEILAVEVPPDPVLAAADVKRVTALLNQTEGIDITTRYESGHVLVEGSLGPAIAAKPITLALAKIPGVRSVTNTVTVQPAQIPVRIFFNPASATMPPVDQGYKLKQVLWFLQHDSNQQVRIIGHSDPSAGDPSPGLRGARALALRRADAVRAALVSQGADPNRLQLWGVVERSPGERSTQLAWQRRYVEFEPIAAVVKPH